MGRRGGREGGRKARSEEGWVIKWVTEQVLRHITVLNLYLLN